MKKIISTIMVLLIVICCFVGCVNRNTPKKEVEDLTGTLEVKVMNKGYGTEFLYKMAQEYKKLNPDCTINITPESDIASIMSNELPLGPDLNDTDLYFGSDVNFPTYYDDNRLDKFGYESYLYDFTDFVKNGILYDGKLVNDTIDSTLIDMLTYSEKVWALPWAAGATGIMYRTDIFEEVGVSVPKTTDELLELTDKILSYNEIHKNDKGFIKIYPFAWAGGDAAKYMQYFTNVWWAQYEGSEMFQKYWSLNDGDPFDPQKKYLCQQGQLEAMKVSEQLIKENVCYPNSNTLKTYDVQRFFAKGGDGFRCAMMPCGDWFENETIRKGATVAELSKIKTMETPKLSSAITKHGGAENVENLAYTLAGTHNVIIPAYSNKTFLAKDFLSFVYSEDGAKIFTECTGSFLALKDIHYVNDDLLKKMTNFQKSQYEIVKNTTYIYSSQFKSPLRYAGSLEEVPESLDYPEKMMSLGKTAQEVWDSYNKYHNAQWLNYIEEAGL